MSQILFKTVIRQIIKVTVLLTDHIKYEVDGKEYFDWKYRETWRL